MHRPLILNDARRSPREHVYWRTQVNRVGQRHQPFDAHVVDISPFGCMVRSDADVEAGEAITLVLPVIRHRAARIVWVLGGRIGIEFARSVELADYLSMLARMKGNP